MLKVKCVCCAIFVLVYPVCTFRSMHSIDENGMPSFNCDNGDTVPYTLVCDFYPDCLDSSDEDFCVHPPCNAQRKCKKSQQCVDGGVWCDDRQHCRDGSDEEGCGYTTPGNGQRLLPSPAIVNFDGFGRSTKSPLQENDSCPNTHVLCPGSYCLPVFVVCNGIHDCPGWEDEAQCDSYTCPGFYRCRRSFVCLHPLHLCDDIFHCPYHDDELMCDVACPTGCLCQGLSAVCSQPFHVDQHTRFRYVDFSGSRVGPAAFQSNTFIVFLRSSNCQIKSPGALWMPNLQILDLRGNRIDFLHMDSFVRLGNLRTLLLSGNPVSSTRLKNMRITQSNLRLVDLSNTKMQVFDSGHFLPFQKMTILNLSFSAISGISKGGLQHIPSLKILDVRGTKLENFQSDVFLGLTKLSKIYADNYKLCCPATLPEYFLPQNCLAPVDELSTCEDLLPSAIYQVCIWVFAAMAVAGNIGSVVFKMWLQKENKVSGFIVLVIQLSISDLCMGMYLVLVGSADLRYRGQYLWYDAIWKHSILCEIAGFLSFMSAEVSAFIIFLITMDRFIVFAFPFSDVRFSNKSALVACGVVWLFGVVLAGVPLLSVTSHWEYYSQSGICIPLPITRKDFAGRDYSFAVMIVLNLVVFLLIAVGQASIYWSIYKTSKATAHATQAVDRKSRDAAVVRRLSAVVVSDFLCWFPIGLLGVLSSVGVPVPGWLNVAVAILVLPINSAVNPFLYTYNVLMERRRKALKAQRQQVLDRVLHNFKQQQTAETRAEAVMTVS